MDSCTGVWGGTTLQVGRKGELTVSGSRENHLCLNSVVVRGRKKGPRPSPLQLDRLTVQITSHHKGSP